MEYNGYEYYGLWNEINAKNGIDYIPNYQNYLDEIYEGTIHSALEFLHGYCVVYAYIFAKKTRCDIITIKDYTGGLIHAYCIKEEDNKTYYFDIRGATTDKKKFFEEFEVDLDKENYWDFYSFEVYHNDIRGQIDVFFDKFVKDCGIDESDHREILMDGLSFVELFI